MYQLGPGPSTDEFDLLRQDVGIVEDTDTATHNISQGQYVIWKNNLYVASAAIATGNTLSSSNLTEVSNGLGGEVKSLSDQIGTVDIGTVSSLTALETGLKNVLATMKAGQIKTFLLATDTSFTLLPNTGGYSGFIQARAGNPPTSCIVQLYNQLQVWKTGYNNNGTFTWKTMS